MYPELVHLIKVNNIGFERSGRFAVSDDAIAKAEAEIGNCLPTSYKWWLKTYGLGEIAGDMIVTIDEHSAGVTDLVESFNQMPDASRVLVAVGNAEYFYADLTQIEDNECPIFLSIDGQEIEYSSTFAAYCVRRISEKF